MYNSLSEQFRPKQWEDLIGNNIIKAQLKYKLTNNEATRALLFCGGRGTGKTTAANIFWKTLLCKNRELSDPNPCGVCEVCTGKDDTNITIYDVTDGAEAKENFARLIKIANMAPIPDPSAVNKIRKRVILINEIQEASSTAQNNLLVPLENARPDVLWILVTMHEHKLTKALVERCTPIKMSTPSNTDIVNHITNCLPNITKDGVEALIDITGSENIRAVWSYLDGIYPLHKEEVIDSDLIYSKYAGGCTQQTRKVFWTNINNNNTAISYDLLEQWLTEIDEERVCDILLKDLYRIKPNKLFRELALNLSIWKKAIHKPPLKLEIKFVVDTIGPFIPVKEEIIKYNISSILDLTKLS
jgi:DNA polymerase-3 subunit gamma/tau